MQRSLAIYEAEAVAQGAEAATMVDAVHMLAEAGRFAREHRSSSTLGGDSRPPRSLMLGAITQ